MFREYKVHTILMIYILQDKDLVVTLYTETILSTNTTLRLNALESFRKFAKVTPYQELINHIANQNDDINKRIVGYCKGAKVCLELRGNTGFIMVYEKSCVDFYG